jgi:nucleoside-diphosphate-sugar epimerase
MGRRFAHAQFLYVEDAAEGIVLAGEATRQRRSTWAGREISIKDLVGPSRG